MAFVERRQAGIALKVTKVAEVTGWAPKLPRNFTNLRSDACDSVPGEQAGGCDYNVFEQGVGERHRQSQANQFLQ